MATSGTHPTSALLQDMLREKKAQTQIKKTYNASNGYKSGLDDRDIQSSPIASMSARDRLDTHSRRGSGIGVRSVTMPKEMGIREMEEYISKINKQNFDLKLEVFHRRQRTEILEAKVEKLQQLEGDNQELQSINEDLLLELEKRDVAIQEAVSLICELEAKNEELQAAVVKMDFSHSSSSSEREPAKQENEIMASPLSTISGTEQNGRSCHTDIGVQAHLKVPSEHSLAAPDTLSPPKSISARRIPSFLRDMTRGTNVLRSMYSSDGNASFVSLGRPVSLFSGDDDDDCMDPLSPRLSILSESGFESIYGGHKDQTFGETDGEDDIAEPHLPKLPGGNTQRESRLHRWLDERNMPRTPSPKSTANDKVSSIGEVLSQAPTSFRDRNSAETTLVGQQPRVQRVPEKRHSKRSRSPEKRTASPTFAGPIFGSPALPPTPPDTMSTATLDANSSNGSASPGSSRDITRKDMSARSDVRGISGTEAPSRPSLTICRTDTFGGESLSASRTLSYPSPSSRVRRLSAQRSPKSYRGSDFNSEKTVDQSPQERLRSGSAAIVTPTRSPAKDDRRSPLSSKEAIVPSPITALPQLSASPPAQRSSSLRSKLVSKFTRSSNNNNNNNNNNNTRIPNPSPKPQDMTPSRPPVTRAPASTQHARLPRPASLYGQHPRIHVSSPSPSPTYELSPILPEGMMLTDLERYSAGSARNLERGRDCE